MPEKAAKSRVAVRLKEAVGASKARNRSADLVKLKEEYLAFTKKLKGLIAVLKDHHRQMMEITKTRLAVAKEVAKLAERSPIYDCTSELPSPDHPPEQVCSYVSIHTKVADKAKSYISKYAQFVVEYVIEWEKVVTARISVGLKKAEDLRRDLDHYQQKVESLRLSANQSMAKGKMVDSKSADKLSRNEEKFMKSKQEYDVFATDLCILIEEVTERSWRDLHPLMIKLAQFDMTMSDDESKMMGQMNQVVKGLKDVAKKNKLSPQPRLKEIEHQKPELLNTRGTGGDLRIEAGADSNGSVFGSTTTPLAMPPGSVAPQGLGGFPVQVASDDAGKGPPDRSTSFGSTASGPGSFPVPTSTHRTMRSAPGAPSTHDILQMSSAAPPPPTMDQVNDAQSAPYGFGRSASGGLPPLGPNSGGGFSSAGGHGRDTDSAYGGSAYGGSGYGGDALSVYSGASAPAPAAPPPPPPMAPPAPPQPMSMYPPANPPPAQQSWNSYPQQSSYPAQQPSYQPQQQQTSPFGMPQQPPSYGMPQPTYGQPPAPYGGGGPPQRGTPLQSTNPFDD